MCVISECPNALFDVYKAFRAIFDHTLRSNNCIDMFALRIVERSKEALHFKHLHEYLEQKPSLSEVNY